VGFVVAEGRPCWAPRTDLRRLYILPHKHRRHSARSDRLCLVTRFDVILCSPCLVNSNIDIRDRKNRVRAPKAKSNVFHCKKTDATIHLPGYRTAISEDLLKLLAEKRLGLFLRKVLCYKTVSTEPKGAGWKQLCNVIGR
jgi:hypothetical protein